MKQDITWRKAKQADLPEVHDMLHHYVQLERSKYDPTMFVHWAASRTGHNYLSNRLRGNNHFFIVAEYNQKVRGFLIGSAAHRSEARRPAKSGKVEVLYVRRHFRGQGLGSLMIRAFDAWCRKKGIGHVSIMVSAKNRKAAEVYRHLGFREYNFILEKELT
ncbi:MAG: GNAT family N-acetyltransferase [Patescibacteria group bacterium]